MKKFAVILSGSGVFDGAEIHEATLTLLAIMKQGASYSLFAPDIPQCQLLRTGIPTSISAGTMTR